MARYKHPRKTWQYTEEFKVKAVQLSLLPENLVKEVAEQLDIHPFMLSRWRKEYREGLIVADGRRKTPKRSKDNSELTRIQKLEAENTKLRWENDVLKKWQRFLAETHQTDIDSSRGTGSSA